MNGTKELTPDKIGYLTETSLKIREVIDEGTSNIYQWNLNKEINFISRVLTDGIYSLQWDADRLNSLKNLNRLLDRHKDWKRGLIGKI